MPSAPCVKCGGLIMPTEGVTGHFRSPPICRCPEPPKESQPSPESPESQGGGAEAEAERYGWYLVKTDPDGVAWVKREEAESHFDAFVEGQEDARADLQQERDSLRSSLVLAKEALEWYAAGNGVGWDFKQTVRPDKDGKERVFAGPSGQKARAALAAMGKVGGTQEGEKDGERGE